MSQERQHVLQEISNTCNRLLTVLGGKPAEGEEDHAELSIYDGQMQDLLLRLQSNDKGKARCLDADTLRVDGQEGTQSADISGTARDDVESSESEHKVTESNRGRRVYSKLTRMILEKVYAQHQHLDRAERIRLSKATELSTRQITVWVCDALVRSERILIDKNAVPKQTQSRSYSAETIAKQEQQGQRGTKQSRMLSAR